MTEPASLRYVTGSEAGLSGTEQIRIALQTIIHHGGVAKISQIIQDVEAALLIRDSSYRLSEQGKASLRFFVNKVAAEAGYIYEHDPRSPGWRITPKGQDSAASSPSTPLHAKMLTPIGQDFQLALSDVYTLLAADKQTTPSTHNSTAAFIRSGIILTVTAWETFIEDTLKVHFKNRLEQAIRPEDILNTFNAVAAAWINRLGEKRLKPQDLARWSGDGWKTLITEYFSSELLAFNTPKSENIVALFKRYIGYDIKAVWKWSGITPDEASSRLDELVSMRGALVHRGRTSTDPTPYIDRERLIAMITLVEQLAWTTEIELNSTLH